MIEKFRKKLPISIFRIVVSNIQQPSHNKLRFSVKTKNLLKTVAELAEVLKRSLFILFCVHIAKIEVEQ